ncbi:hypothetical protein PFICI_10181 [Pestalotiopsis fici W106-1]|uniref:Heterokaryon incompatibility domain-containing protein n=1 Tax=Pestalotiopsis fici (strain W106-1 / CGMCC3.15140) TaxID=1229662 RepID=W3WWD7_PESFW|nr:uncharacterized protein PFICI_10181 [Pestalotiopsis fici W106-1]ETS78119.1 hypothetical protein PFICI_10181 [Pestalotiopsis fici W106-1]
MSSLQVEDNDDISSRRVPNNYSAYRPITLTPGNEQIRLMQILPPESEDEDEEIVCALFDVPPIWQKGQIVYIALSYCWGDLGDQKTISVIHQYQDAPEETQKARDLEGSKEDSGPTMISVERSTKQQFNVTRSLFSALKSIRKATPRVKEQFPLLDFQPIWIDALCINQGLIEERNHQVGMMNKIYSSAFFVWIWLGEDEAVMRGLNMIHAMMKLTRKKWGDEFDPIDPKEEHMRHFLRTPYQLDGELLGPESCFKILDSLFDNPYFKRVWVLQEATAIPARTFVFVTVAHVPWAWIIVADRFRQLWRKIYPTGQNGSLPQIWANLIQQKLIQPRTPSLVSKHLLYDLFINTYEEFNATDLRDKLFALIGLSAEGNGSQGTIPDLIQPDYSKSLSQVFIDFTRFCIMHGRGLEVLSLLCGGPRRLFPFNPMLNDPSLPKPKACLDVRLHPSWALWPTTGGSWTVSSLAKAQQHSGHKYDLASRLDTRQFDLLKHPTYELPSAIVNRILRWAGVRIGVVKSIFNLPIRCFADSEPPERSIITKKWATEPMEKEMAKHEKHISISLTSPHVQGDRMKGGLIPLWCYLERPMVNVIEVEDQVAPLRPQEWLGRKGGRYEGKREHMFRDFLETLLLSPIYHGPTELVDNEQQNDQAQSSESEDGTLMPGPWDDPELSISFAMEWAQFDPQMEYLPPRIGKHLLDHLFKSGIPREKQFPFLFLGHGKCFFITDDEHMGMCSPDVEPGDIVVALPGSGVPFVLRPMEDQADIEGEDWTFKGDHEGFRKTLFRFMGECYLHGRMTSDFFRHESGNLPPMETFNIC